MSARIRGHYRIDSSGRVEAMTDVNSAALKSRIPPPVPAEPLQSRLIRICVAGFVTAALCVGGMLAMPEIQRYIVSSQSARYAMVRHMHGHRMHSMAERLLHGDWYQDR